jgi:integrase
MNEALDIYFDVHASKKKSINSFKTSIKHIKELLGTKYVDTLTRIDVQAYRSNREKESKASTVNREQTVITHLINILKELNQYKTINVQLPEQNPGSLVKKVNERPFARKRVLTGKEFAHFCTFINDDVKDICVMAVLTMLRRKDLKNLTKDNINLSTNQLEGVQAKTGKPFSIPITPAIQSIINKSKTNRILNFKNFRRHFEKARLESGLQHFRFADFRRSGARTMLLNGTDIQTVSEYLGHSDLRMTQVYVPPSQNDFKKAAESLTKAYSIA